MTPLIQLNRRLLHLFIALLLACFAIAQNGRAVTPEPDGGDDNANMAEEDNALPDLSTGSGNAAMGQPTPKELGRNKWMIPIDFTQPLQCAGGNVSVHAELVLRFVHVPGSGVSLESVKLEGFRGTASAGKRPLEHKKTSKFTFGGIKLGHENGQGRGQIGGIKFEVTGPGLPAAEKPLLFKVEYAPLSWEFKDGKVTNLKRGTLEIRCMKK
jgi:hypothetical protein